MTGRPIVVSVVSGSPVVARGVASLLAGHSDRIDVVPAAGNTAVDVTLFDPSGRADADERVLAELLADPANGAVVVYGETGSQRATRDAYQLGVRGFLSQSLGGDALADAIVGLALGRASASTARPAGGRQRAVWLGRDDGLTERESQVLVLCAEGLSNQEIADALFVNLETVKSHLKRAYSRLGLRNRAQATAYVHRSTSGGSIAGIDWIATTQAAPPAEAVTLVVDPADLADRLRLMRLDGGERSTLRPLVPEVEHGAAEFIERLVARWRAQPETARLVADAGTRDRLISHQRGYLSAVFGGALDAEHAAAMVRVGVVHHRLRVEPQWYLASCAHLICDHIPVALGAGDHVDRLATFVSSVLFDAGLVLDAYEFAAAEHLRRALEPQVRSDVAESHRAPPAARPTRQAFAEVVPAAVPSEARRRFLGLDDAAVATLRSLSGAVEAAMPVVLDAFYALAASDATVARHFSDGVVARLRREVTAFWRATTEADFGTAHVATRMRVGVVHEQIGLPPQWYLAGLAAQLGGLLRALARTSTDLARDADVLVRAAFLDATLVIDAYLAAREKALLQTGRFAAQVIAGMADGVAIVDARDRIEFANEPFLDLVGVTAAVLHRMPIDAAVPIEGVRDLVASARDGGGRVTAVHTLHTRTLRLIAIRLDGTAAGRGVLVALVVDDITDVLRAYARHERIGRRVEQVLDAVDAFAWELDAASFVFLAASHASERVTGRRSVDLLGKVRLTEVLHPDDAEAFVVGYRRLQPGDDAQYDHRILLPDGTVRWVRSSIAATVGEDGAATCSGVTSALRPA